MYLFLEYMRGEGGRKRGRGTSMCERHQLVASCMHPHWGPNLQPRHVPWLVIKLVTFRCVGRCPAHWATAVRVRSAVLLTPKWSIIWQRNWDTEQSQEENASVSLLKQNSINRWGLNISAISTWEQSSEKTLKGKSCFQEYFWKKS